MELQNKVKTRWNILNCPVARDSVDFMNSHVCDWSSIILNSAADIVLSNFHEAIFPISFRSMNTGAILHLALSCGERSPSFPARPDVKCGLRYTR
jgi:hypothetical protein